MNTARAPKAKKERLDQVKEPIDVPVGLGDWS
jgi:hypothetical protein